ncbi:hypothetical protein PR048_021521 [Dryococelus australis]|uniref:Uncharacterized protein n=1 Tax=Dryococelus australis TaxID=614101 RepID=A0ABQ9GYF4_9NEOP|nr:hypothetical protein PR048_021521 [Dryococelus australis]
MGWRRKSDGMQCQYKQEYAEKIPGNVCHVYHVQKYGSNTVGYRTLIGETIFLKSGNCDVSRYQTAVGDRCTGIMGSDVSHENIGQTITPPPTGLRPTVHPGCHPLSAYKPRPPITQEPARSQVFYCRRVQRNHIVRGDAARRRKHKQRLNEINCRGDQSRTEAPYLKQIEDYRSGHIFLCILWGRGGAAARPPPRRTGFDSRWGRFRIIASGNRTRRCRCSASLLGCLPFPSPPPSLGPALRCCSILTSLHQHRFSRPRSTVCYLKAVHDNRQALRHKHFTPVQRIARMVDGALGGRVIVARIVVPRTRKKYLGPTHSQSSLVYTWKQPRRVIDGEYGAAPECKRRGIREFPEKTHRPAASSSTIPISKKSRSDPAGD